VGIDEVGRGALAGPVVAAAVILPANLSDHDDRADDDGGGTQEYTREYRNIRDSKKLSQKARERLADYIQRIAVDYAIGCASPQEIDKMNILHATHLAMHRALDKLSVDFDHILVDGDRFAPYMRLRVSNSDSSFATHDCLVGGDDKVLSIAAASILAKVTRDRMMRAATPANDVDYAWQKNVGYGTAEHTAALQRHGPEPGMHRTTFIRKWVMT
jgi:ribonuclease HII